MSDFFKKLEWQDKALLVIIILICASQYSQFSQFAQVPGPLYGGDLYFHYGHAVELRDGGSVFASNHYLGEYEHYPWLFHIIIASLASMLGVSVMPVFIFFPIVITILAGIIFYLLMLKITGNKTIALLSAFLWMAMEIPSSHPTTFAAKVIIPLFALALLYVSSWKTGILAGIAYGLTGLTHVTAFLGASLILVLFFLYKIIEKDKKADYAEKIKKAVILLFPVFVIGVLIAMLYWWAPIFVYHGQTPNNWQEYSGTGVAGLNAGWIATTLGSVFLNTSGIFIFIISIVSLFGLYVSAKHYKKFPFVLVVFIAAFIGMIHPILTIPIIKTSFGFYRFPAVILMPVSVMLFGLGALVISNSLKKEKTRNIFFVIVAAIILLNFFSVYGAFEKSQWTAVGKSVDPGTKALFTAADFIQKNTNVNDVFISMSGESAFAMNALTGRKVIYLRPTHSSPYVDANRRIADAAVILYGNNSLLRSELLSKYNVSYFFFDQFSGQSTAACLQAWDKFGDPQYEGYTYYCMATSEAYKNYLEENGVETKTVFARIDPASVNAPKFNLLLVKPSQLKLNITPIDGRSANNQTIYIVGRVG